MRGRSAAGGVASAAWHFPGMGLAIRVSRRIVDDQVVPYLVSSVVPRIIDGVLPYVEEQVLPRLVDAATPLCANGCPLVIQDLTDDPLLRTLLLEQSRSIVDKATERLRGATSRADDRVEHAFHESSALTVGDSPYAGLVSRFVALVLDGLVVTLIVLMVASLPEVTWASLSPIPCRTGSPAPHRCWPVSSRHSTSPRCGR